MVNGGLAVKRRNSYVLYVEAVPLLLKHTEPSGSEMLDTSPGGSELESLSSLIALPVPQGS